MSRSLVEYRSASRETYKKFCKQSPELKLSYNDFCIIIYSFNYAFRDYILETGKVAKMPWGFGDFTISKKKRRREYTNKEGNRKIGLPINWAISKQLGRRVYHLNYNTEGYIFRWKWFGETARIFKTDIWKFKASRVSSRLIKHYISEGYSDKYQEWESI